VFLLAAGIALSCTVYLYGQTAVFALLPAVFFIFSLVAMGVTGAARESFLNAALKTAGLVYIALPLSCYILVYGLEDGRWWILFFLTVLWFNDSLAYAVGKAVGRTKLSPAISPGKTVEGSVGGVLGGVGAAFAFNYIVGFGKELYFLAGLAVAIGVVALLGDLIESMLKRGAGFKDSGTIVPGHGGILDRIDSMIFSLPLLYYILLFARP